MIDVQSNLAMWTMLVGFALPPVLAAVIEAGWSSRVKSVVAFVASVAAGAGTAWFGGALTGRDVVTCALIVLTVAQATYHGFWKPAFRKGA